MEDGNQEGTPAAAPEQALYARVLRLGSQAGLAALVVTQILYLTGAMPAYVAPEQIGRYWGMSASDFVKAAGAPTGWGWLGMLRYGDFLNLLGIAMLGSVTVVGCLALLRVYLARRDGIYAAIVALELLVLGLAASGVVAGGH